MTQKYLKSSFFAFARFTLSAFSQNSMAMHLSSQSESIPLEASPLQWQPARNIDTEEQPSNTSEEVSQAESVFARILSRALQRQKLWHRDPTTSLYEHEFVTESRDQAQMPSYFDVVIARLHKLDEINCHELRRTQQCCYLCFTDSHQLQFALPVPCLRPPLEFDQLKRERSFPIEMTTYPAKQWELYNKTKLDIGVYESDAAIYRRLYDLCFFYQGSWKQRIPFYGIIDVKEVKFQFLGVAERDGRSPILMKEVNLSRARKEAEVFIALATDPDDSDTEDYCFEGHHGYRCDERMNDEDILAVCKMDELYDARQRKKRLQNLGQLKKCAREPSTANGLRTLEGMAQKSCIYDFGKNDIPFPVYNKRYDRSDEFRGLHFVLGWQKDRLFYDLPLTITKTWFAVAVIWAAMFIWAGPKGDWNTAMAFGQLVAASATLLFTLAK